MKKSTFYIVGKHAVVGALKNPSRKVLRVFLTEDSKNRINRENQNTNLLKNIKIFYKTKRELDKFIGREEINHQGFVAEIMHLERTSLKDFLNKSNDFELIISIHVRALNALNRYLNFLYKHYLINNDNVFRLDERIF